MTKPAPVLVVDDDADFRDAVSRALVAEGYRVVCAEDGIQALAILDDLEPALLFIDVAMPAMSGPELVRELQTRGRVSPYHIVMISAQDMPRSAQGRWRLKKPVDYGLLLQVVQDFCGRTAPVMP